MHLAPRGWQRVVAEDIWRAAAAAEVLSLPSTLIIRLMGASHTLKARVSSDGQAGEKEGRREEEEEKEDLCLAPYGLSCEMAPSTECVSQAAVYEL